MDRRRALWLMHGATVLFGISGIFGKLIASSAAVLVFGRAIFALAAMSLLLMKLKRLPWRDLDLRSVGRLCACGALLCAHWVTFFIAVSRWRRSGNTRLCLFPSVCRHSGRAAIPREIVVVGVCFNTVGDDRVSVGDAKL